LEEYFYRCSKFAGVLFLKRMVNAFIVIGGALLGYLTLVVKHISDSAEDVMKAITLY
jgi:hypothetical protein